jgi:hypothetical protein
MTILRLRDIEVSSPALHCRITQALRFSESNLMVREGGLRVVRVVRSRSMWCGGEREGKLILRR